MSTGGFDYGSDPQRLIDDLRSFLAGDDQTVTTGVQGMARAYAEACIGLNDQMRRCHEFLRVSLWTEAIQLAEIEPKVVERFGLLNFPERQQFDELTSIYDELEKAPQLLPEVYEELNEAYNYHVPLERLFIRHRLLAMKRAPLRARLKVMRQLAERDELANFWEDDVIAYERELLEEIREDARAAAERRDLGTLQEFEQELQSPDWFELPPSKWIKAVRSLIDKIEQSHSDERLPELTERLVAHWDYWNQSFQLADPLVLGSDPNWQAATNMVTEWFADAERAAIMDTDPLYVQVSPIDQSIRNFLEAIKQAKAKQEVLDRFHEALRDPQAGRQRLRAAYEELARWGVVAADLKTAYDKRMKSEWWRNNWERVVGVGLFLMIVGGLLVFFVVSLFLQT